MMGSAHAEAIAPRASIGALAGPRRRLAALALALALGAAALTAWSSYPAAFYRHHGYSPAGLAEARPVLELPLHSFVLKNYLWALARVAPHTDATIHVNRIAWFLVAAATGALVVLRISGRAAAAFLAFVIVLNIPTLASARLWSLSVQFNMASAFACLALWLEWPLVTGEPGRGRRIGAVALYVLSVVVMEYFYALPLILVVMHVLYHWGSAGAARRSMAFARSVIAWYLLPVLALTAVIFVSRKNFMALGTGLWQVIVSEAYVKSVIGQLTSNVGDRFALFLVDNLVRYYERVPTGMLLVVGLLSLAITLTFVGLGSQGEQPGDQRARRRTLVGGGIAIVLVSVFVNSVAIYAYTLGYGEDHVNQAIALGATMAMAGVLDGLVARGGWARWAGILACVLVLFAMTKAATLQAADWSRVREWEIRLGEDFRAFTEREGRPAQTVVVVRGFPRFVSSFGFDPGLIWFAWAPPRLEGPPGAYYGVPVAALNGARASWRGRIERHFRQDFRFWPMLIAPVHPTAESLGDARGLTLVHVDAEFGVACQPGAIVVPRYEGTAIRPTAVPSIVFGHWREAQRTTFRRVTAEECEALAETVNAG
jgi:hypothetical protein